MSAPNGLPDALVPADLDVRSIPGFILDVEKMENSEILAMSTGDQFKAAFRLWCKAWKQVPAGSLPNNELVLASWSGAGPRWPKVRDMALHGFIACSDGRLYHPVLCADATRAAKARQQRKDAIDARWKKTGKAPERTPEPTGDDTAVKRDPYHTPSPTPPPVQNSELRSVGAAGAPDLLTALNKDDIKLAFDAYNELAERVDLPRAMTLGTDRRTGIRARLMECGGLDGWRAALEKLGASPHCRGENDRGWRADLDFLIQPKSFRRLMEGRYDDRRGVGAANGHGGGARSSAAQTDYAGMAEAVARARSEGGDVGDAG